MVISGGQALKGNLILELNRNLYYLSQYYGMKFVKDYLTRVGYKDKGLEKYPERERENKYLHLGGLTKALKEI